MNAPRGEPHNQRHPLHRKWFALWGLGWTPEKIASAWNQPLVDVEKALEDADQQPLSPEPILLALPKAKATCDKRRRRLRELFKQGWSLATLQRITRGIYTREFLEEIAGTSAKSA